MAVQPDRSCAVANEAGYGAHDIPQNYRIRLQYDGTRTNPLAPVPQRATKPWMREPGSQSL
jgi:hypothetical protein